MVESDFINGVVFFSVCCNEGSCVESHIGLVGVSKQERCNFFGRAVITIATVVGGVSRASVLEIEASVEMSIGVSGR